MNTQYNAKLIALDLDDTLLKDDLSISDNTVHIIQEAVKRGIYIVLSSGRSENAILPHVRRLDIAGKIEGKFIISQNGALITDLHERKIIYSKILDGALLQEAYEIVKAHNLVSQVYDQSTIFIPYKNEWTERDIKLSGLHFEIVPEYNDFLAKGHPKMVIPGEPAKLQELEKLLKARFNKRAVIFTSKPYFLEIVPFNSGKGEALLWLADYISVPHEQVMAFGDGMNDESMIRLAPLSVAMKNGCDFIKNIAKHHTEHTNNDDGVAEFIKKYVL